MTMRTRFTDEEWGLIRHIPFDAFIFGALADKHIAPEEVAAFTETFARSAEIRDPLHREIALDYVVSGASSISDEMEFQLREGSASLLSRLQQTKPILREKLTAEEYQSFVTSVTMNAMAVAAASTTKKGLFRKKQHISPEEAKALSTFAVIWDVDPAALAGRLGMPAPH